MRIVFFGSGAFGLPTLERLAGEHEIAAVVTQPDKPAGRGGALTPTPVGEWATGRLRSPIFKPDKVNDAAMVGEIRGLNADAWVVIAFGQKLGRKLLEGVFAINLHASLLPRWRGAAPINAAILAGDKVTGNSVITLADRMDAGEVLGRSRLEIASSLTAGELHDLLARDGPELVVRVLKEHVEGTLKRTVQDESLATLAPKLSKADGWVDFGDAAENTRRRVHGLTPWPGVTVQFRGQPVKVLQVEVGPDAADQKPGTIVDPHTGLIACGASLLRVLKVQAAGKKAMPWDEFARGQRITAGEQLIGGKPQ